MLAEAPTFSGPEILVILLVLLGILAAGAAVVGAGCVWAWMAGRGSQRALVGWMVVASLEALVLAASIPPFVTDLSLFLILPLGVIALQVALFLGGRSGARTGP